MLNDEVLIYDIKLNKNRLKSIRKKIIRKYGICSKTIYISNKKDFYKNVKNNGVSKVTYVNLKDMDKSVSYKKVTIPILATYISEILKGNDKYIDILRKLNTDTLGVEYLSNIKDNIKIEDYGKRLIKKH